MISWFKVRFLLGEDPLGEPLHLAKLADSLDVNQEAGFLIYVQHMEDGSKTLYLSPVAVLYFAELLRYSWRAEECDPPAIDSASFDLVYGRPNSV